jgi:hypothetical protein
VKHFKTLILTLLLGSQLSSNGQWRKLDVDSVSVPEDANIYVFGDTLILSSYQGSIRSTDKGSSWSDLSEDEEYCDFISGNIGIMQTLYSGPGITDSLFFTYDAGVTWVSPVAIGKTDQFANYLYDSTVIVPNYDSTNWKLTKDLGLSWVTINIPIPDSINGKPSKIGEHFIYGDTLFVISGGFDVSAGNFVDSPRLFFSYDLGQTWNTKTLPNMVCWAKYSCDNGQQVSISADSRIAYISGSGIGNGFVIHSSNLGLSWDSIPLVIDTFDYYSMYVGWIDSKIVLGCTATSKSGLYFVEVNPSNAQVTQ